MKLTRKQEDVLVWTLRGKTEKEISIILGVSEAGIKMRKRIMKRNLDATSGVELIYKGLEYMGVQLIGLEKVLGTRTAS